MLTHQLQVAFEPAGGKDDRLRAKVIRHPVAEADAPHAPYLAVLDEQGCDFGIPDEVNVRPTQTFPVDGADESDSTLLRQVLTLDAVTWQEREKPGPTHAQRIQPVVDLALGIPRIETDPIRVCILAMGEEIANGQVWGVGDVVRALKRRVHQTDQASRHDRMAAAHRPHVND